MKSTPVLRRPRGRAEDSGVAGQVDAAAAAEPAVADAEEEGAQEPHEGPVHG
jgi:hypothetical protein